MSLGYKWRDPIPFRWFIAFYWRFLASEKAKRRKRAREHREYCFWKQTYGPPGRIREELRRDDEARYALRTLNLESKDGNWRVSDPKDSPPPKERTLSE